MEKSSKKVSTSDLLSYAAGYAAFGAIVGMATSSALPENAFWVLSMVFSCLVATMTFFACRGEKKMLIIDSSIASFAATFIFMVALMVGGGLFYIFYK
ncbi:hypothetical protein HY249_01640 [Candidatus Azambacteria bacterium]|nr:hypothetical protein [Candidatus Azambacteria bacterium]